MLATQIDDLIDLSGLGAPLGQIKEEILAFLDALYEHECRESDLLQDAYLTDVGTGD